MQSVTRLSLLLVGVLLFPAVHAGSSASPELTDAANDAPGPVDILSAWFSNYRAPATTGDSGVDCTLATCREGFRVTLRLRDLALAAPVADADPASVRYYYDIRFTPSTWGSEVLVSCVLNLADIGAANVNYFGPETGVGVHCTVPAGGATGGSFDVASNQVWTSDRAQRFSLTEVAVDRLAGTLTVTLVEDLADIGPGTTFSGLTASTSIGSARAGVPLFTRVAADATGVGADWTM